MNDTIHFEIAPGDDVQPATFTLALPEIRSCMWIRPLLIVDVSDDILDRQLSKFAALQIHEARMKAFANTFCVNDASTDRCDNHFILRESIC